MAYLCDFLNSSDQDLKRLAEILVCIGILLCLTCGEIAARASYNAFGVNVRPSYVMSTHGFYRGWNPQGKDIMSAANIDVQFGIGGNERGVYQGIGLALHSFFAHDLMGTPASIYVYQGAPLAALGKNLTLGYEWNLGLSSGWKYNEGFIVSPLNVYINVAALFDWKVNQHWDIVFGPEYTHFSNGDTKFPNSGANTVNFRLGAKRHIAPSNKTETVRVFAGDIDNETFADRMTYDLSILGGFRADRTVSGTKLYIFNKAFPVASVNFNPLYSFNSHLAAGPSVDLIYDRSANLNVWENEDKTVDFEYPRALAQTGIGLSARAELRMPVFAINIGIGYGTSLEDHTRYDNDDLKGLYGVFNLKTFVSDRMFLNVGYRLKSVLYSHNLLFGLGWRL